MDATPFVFRERVATLWKCCEYQTHNSQCVALRVPVCEWRREMTRISLYICSDRGQWKYGFSCSVNTDSFLSLAELQKSVNFEQVTIQAIAISVWDIEHDNLTNLCGNEVERLMKLIVHLSNEPYLNLTGTTAEIFNTPLGSALLKCLSKIQFSRIDISESPPVYNQLFGNQLSRRNPTKIFLYGVNQNREFFMKNLKNGRIKYFEAIDDYSGNSNDYFPAEVMAGIVNSFLKNPEEYKEEHFRISAHFDGSTEAMLERKVKKGTCERDANGEYRFTAYNSKLQRRQHLSVQKCGESLYVFTTRAL